MWRPMSLMSKEDKELSKVASGLSDSRSTWKKTPTPIATPSNNTSAARPQRSQNPWGRGRLENNIDARPDRVSGGNPNRTSTVFDKRQSKRSKTQPTSAPREPIDLTTDDAGPASRGSVVADDSDDSLLLTAKRRIADDGPATRRLNERRDAGSSKVTLSDTETEMIEDFPETTKKPVGRVREKVQYYESQNGNGTPKLQLASSNPLANISPVKPRSKVKLNVSITDPTVFTRGTKSRGKQTHVLSLAGWVGCAGPLVKPREHLLSWDMEHNNPVLKVASANGRPKFTFDMKSGIGDLQASSNGVSPLIIKFDVRKFPQSGPHETMAFRVDTDDKSCNESARRALYEFLKNKCQCRGWLDPSGARAAWDAAVLEQNSVASESKEPQLSRHKLPTTDRRNEHPSSVPSHPELPPSIDLSPPPEGEMPLPLKSLQRVEQMNHRPMIREQLETRETTKGEPIAGPSDQPLRRSSRRSITHSGVSEVDPTRTSPSEDPDDLLLVYRPPGTGSVNITRGDFERLQPGKYLNDTLIEFGLKLWLSGLRDSNPELADQIHLFSSFFYKKLAIKDKKAGYESVRKWTSKVDVFRKKYLVVPINENLHWYLAIIYQPEYTLRPAQPSPSPLTRKRKRDEELLVNAPESRGTPTVASKPTSKATTGIPEGGEMETIPDSEPASPSIEFEEQTQTDETAKPEEREVEAQLCADVSSVSLDGHEGSHFRESESAHASLEGEEGMEIDNSPLASPMPIGREVLIEDSIGEPPLLKTIEPSLRAEDSASEAPTVEMEDSFDSNAIPVEGFYGLGPVPPSKRKPRASAPGKLEGGPRGGDFGGVETTPPKTDHTYIFVFDSLNGKHPGAQKNLAQYLMYEAMDKKGIENPSSPESMIAHVPTQDNYCDCGLYLLHFTRVFMEDPAKSFYTILTKRRTPKADRDVDWKKELVGTSREDLTMKILDLSEQWLSERTREAEEKAKAKEREGVSKSGSIAVDSLEESDDDIILEDVVTPKPDPHKKSTASRPDATKKGPAGQGRGRTSPKKELVPAEPETAAQRLR